MPMNVLPHRLFDSLWMFRAPPSSDISTTTARAPWGGRWEISLHEFGRISQSRLNCYSSVSSFCYPHSLISFAYLLLTYASELLICWGFRNFDNTIHRWWQDSVCHMMSAETRPICTMGTSCWLARMQYIAPSGTYCDDVETKSESPSFLKPSSLCWSKVFFLKRSRRGRRRPLMPKADLKWGERDITWYSSSPALRRQISAYSHYQSWDRPVF